MTRLLIVEDSAVMRNLLAQMFEEEGGYEVRLATNGMEAVEENRTFQPDVVTMDINMPRMDGIAALSRIMAERPVPVVMVSSMTAKGAMATLEALNLGAVDFIAKPDGIQIRGIEEIRDELLSKVRNAKNAKPKCPASAQVAEPIPTEPRTLRKPSESAVREGIVLMGGSIGSPQTAEEILRRLPGDFAWPIVLALHMPMAITRSLAERLSRCCALEVRETTIPVPVRPGTIYLAQGGTDLVFHMRGDSLEVLPRPENRNHPWHPSLDLLGQSLLELREPRSVIGVMLTGMGSDGADAFAEIKKRGGRTIAESEESAVVFDMPAALIRRGGATAVLPLEEIASRIVGWVGN